METSPGSPEAPGGPTPIGGGLGVVSGHQPPTPGNQALGAPQASSQPSLGWLRSIESTRRSLGTTQALPQARGPQQAFETGPADQLLSGLRGTVTTPFRSGIRVAEAPSSEPNLYKRPHVGSGAENDTPGISGLVKEHCKDLLRPVLQERAGLKTTVKTQAALIEALQLRLERLELVVRALEASRIVPLNAPISTEVGTSDSTPRPVTESGLAPSQSRQAPAASGLAPSLNGRQDPPRHQMLTNHQDQGSPAPGSAHRAPPTSKPSPPPQKVAPKSWASTAGNAQQANAGKWETVHYGKPKATPQAVVKPVQPITKPRSTRSKEERRLIFRREKPLDTLHGDTRDIVLGLNRALSNGGMPNFVRAVNAGYAASGHLTVLLQEGAPSSVLVPAYNDTLITAVRKCDPAVISVEISEQWQRVKVHGVPIQRYMNSENGLSLAREEIELQGVFRLKRDPVWLVSPRKLKTRNQRSATIVVTVGSGEDARKMLKFGLQFGTRRHTTEAYKEVSPESVCPRCCGIGHSNHLGCKERPPKCSICAGDHETLSHACNVVDCQGRPGKACQHCLIKCANCGEAHEATSPRCPLVKQARKHALQRVRDRHLQHRLPAGQQVGVVVPLPLKSQSEPPEESPQGPAPVHATGLGLNDIELTDAEITPTAVPDSPPSQGLC
jgi:hypothetical protein